MRNPQQLNFPQQRLHWQTVLLGDSATITAAMLEEDYFRDAIGDVINSITVEMAMKLFELDGEDTILSDAINRGRLDILNEAENRGWHPSPGLVDFSIATANEAYADGSETVETLRDIVGWFRTRGLISQAQVPGFCN